jgi:hypothetical protein
MHEHLNPPTPAEAKEIACADAYEALRGVLVRCC